MRNKLLFSLVWAIIFTHVFLVGCSNSTETQKQEIIVSSAASLKGVMSEIKHLYEQRNSTITLTFNYGASGSLQKQIEQGAPADIFLSAGISQMDELEQKNLIINDSRTDFLANEMVLVVSQNNKNINSFEDLMKAQKISIGTPESVPAGQYAKEVLTNLNLWATLESKLILAKDVTQVLTYVESENVDAGIVYRSDAHESRKVRVVTTAPANSHSPIIYPAAVVASSKNLTEAKDFMQFISSSEAQAVFVKYGFKANQ